MIDHTSDEATILERDNKILSVFGDLAIDKRRLPMSQLSKRGVPAYVAEWVIDSIIPGHGPLTEAESTKVQAWANKFIPKPGDSSMLKNRLMSGEIIKVLTPMLVEIELTRKKQDRVAKLNLLDIKDGVIGEGLIDSYPALLQQGMWGVVELIHTQEGITISSFRPMQATVNLQLYKDARKQFTLDEWRELMLASMGYNPDAFSLDEQMLLLCRLLPLVQKNMHMIELAPKGTGKSYIYENISPSVRLMSGGNVSPAVLFVNNASGQWGLLARYAVVVLDEVQTLKFEKPEEIVGGLKGYLANGRLTRGGLHETASDCGLVLLANIKLDSDQRPLHSLFIQELPPFLQETAFLDRIRALIPGWEIRKLSSECFSRGVGLKSDFFGDALLALRNDLEHDENAARRIELLGDRVYKRNEDSMQAIASGMLKILFPDGNVSRAEFEQYCVKPARKLRELVWNQMQILDGEYRQYEETIRYQILDE